MQLANMLKAHSLHTASSHQQSELRTLHRRHLAYQRRRAIVVFSYDQDEETRLLEEDMQRLNQRQRQQNPQQLERSRGGIQDTEQVLLSSTPNGAKELLDKVLIADFFFVCAALLGLGAGVAESSILHSRSILDLWYPLWNSIFQPAIGVLMLGALASGALGWLGSRDKD